MWWSRDHGYTVGTPAIDTRRAGGKLRTMARKPAPKNTRSRRGAEEVRAIGRAVSALAVGMRQILLADIDIDMGETFALAGLPAVRRARQTIALDFARAGHLVYQDGQQRQGFRFPLLSGMTGTYGLSAFRWRQWEAATAHEYGRAESLVRKRDTNGRALIVQPIAPGTLEYRVDDAGITRYYLEQQEVDEMNLVIHVWDMNTSNAWMGDAPMDTCRDALRTEAHRASVYRQMVDSGFVGKMQARKEINKIANEVLDELKEKFAGNHTYKKLGNPIIAQEGLKFEAMAADAVARALDGRREGTKELANISDFQVGMAQEADGRQAEDSQFMYALDMQRRLAAWSAEYTVKLCGLGEEIVLDASHLHTAAARSGYRGLAMLVERGVLTRTEARIRVGLQPNPLDPERDQALVLISGAAGTGSEAEGSNGGAQ